MTPAIYNELDAYPAQWLGKLIARGLVAPGEVLEGDVCDIDPDQLKAATQVHLFAGIGAWSYALRLAGWPDDRPAWTVSCPCQPFSDAGAKKGFEDERHLWPRAFRLAQECRPPVIFGEQVASPDGLEWLSVVQSDLEGEGYAFGAADLCAAGVGAPHRRQRLFFVAHADGEGRQGDGWGANMGGSRRPTHGNELLGNAGGDGTREHTRELRGNEGQRQERGSHRAHPPQPTGPDMAWSDPEWVLCHDPGGSRWCPIEPGTLPLVDGAPGRVAQLRAYGNAIVPQVAAEVIRAFMEFRP